MITGNDLIQLGYAPGKWFGPAIEEANARGLSGDVLKQFLEETAPKVLLPFREPVRYHVNIETETELEESNLAAVRSAMDTVMKTPTIVAGAIMPDACPTGEGQIPVGGIAVAENALHPAMHSADICCSVMATNMGHLSPKQVIDAAHAVTHFGGGGRPEFSELPPELTERLRKNPFLNSERSIRLAHAHMATQGDGNHFLFVGQSEKTGETYLVTHHGSRGLGASLYAEGMRTAERFRREIAPQTPTKNAWIPFDTPEGKDYWEALQTIRSWTKLNHETLHEQTARRLNAEPRNRFWNEHNFIFRKNNLFYHAKGATPLEDDFVPDSNDGLRLIPLNMAEPILVVRGASNETNLGFAPHGAGRNMSRSQHKRRNAHQSDEEIFHQETQGLDVRFFSGNIDISELPSAYKNAEEVKRQMRKFQLGRIVDEIIPYGCIMAGDWQKDAFWKTRRNKRSS